MIINAVLIRWRNGWLQRGATVMDDTSPTRIYRGEAMLELGAALTETAAKRTADKIIEKYNRTREQITVGLEPRGESDRPYTSHRVGDKVILDGSPVRVIGIAVKITADEAGNHVVSYAPQLGERLATEPERIATRDKKMSNGTLQGDTPVATPLSAQISASASSEDCRDKRMPFDLEGDLVDVASSNPWDIIDDTVLIGMEISLLDPSDADTTITLQVNGSYQEAHTLPAGSTSIAVSLNTYLALQVGHRVTLTVDTAGGSGGYGLVVHLVHNGCAQGSPPVFGS